MSAAICKITRVFNLKGASTMIRKSLSLAARLILIAALVSSLALTAAPARAANGRAVFIVNSLLDRVDAAPGNGACATATGTCTLRAAIQEANAAAGSDVIVLAAGNYLLTIPGAGEDNAATGDLDITDHLSLFGAGTGSTQINAGGLDRAIHIPGGSVVTFANVTIRNGLITAPGEAGGGIYNAGVLTLIFANVADNEASASGGGIFNAGSLTAVNNTLSGNEAASGGGLSNSGSASLANSAISENVTESGGGVYNAALLAVSNSTIFSNTASDEGGGVFNIGSAAVITLTSSTVVSNAAGMGGGLYNVDGKAVSLGSGFSDNIAEAVGGGGISNQGNGTLIATDSQIIGNQAISGWGGGLDNAGSASFSHGTLSGNYAESGGGLYNTGLMTVTNATVSANGAASFGGGIYQASGTLNVNNATLTANIADVDEDGSGDGGGIYREASTINLANTIVAGNIDPGGQAPDCRGIVMSQGYNLVQSLSGCTLAGDPTGNIIGEEALLGALQDNGGATLTHALLSGSPAVNAANPAAPGGGGGACEAADQRGISRPQGAQCDIGAFETLLVQFSTDSQNVGEAIGLVTVTVDLSSASFLTVTVPYSVSGTALGGGVDHTLADGSFVIPMGNLSHSLTFSVTNDTLDEADEFVTATLGIPSNAVLDAFDVQTITILDDDPMPVVQFITITQSIIEAAGDVTVTVVMSATSSFTVTVPYTVSATATGGGVDFNLVNGTFTIPPGDASRSLAFPVTNDTLDEADEMITLTLGAPANAILGAFSEHTITILDDDQPPTVQFILPDQTVGEADGGGTVLVYLSAASSFTVTVPYNVCGTATGGGVDHGLVSGIFTISPGYISSSLTFTVTNDTLDEADETVILTMGAPVNAVLGPVSVHTITILDNDSPPTVQFVTDAQSVSEGTGVVVVTVYLSTASGRQVTVPYSVGGSAAGGGVDHNLADGSFTIQPGAVSGVITFTVTPDELHENTETISITLGAPVNAALGANSQQIITIFDDDPLPVVKFADASVSVNENESVATITVTLNAASMITVTVGYVSGDGTAVMGSDYLTATGTLTFTPGITTQTFTVTILNDELDEPDETVNLALVDPVNVVIGLPGWAVLTIIDDDSTYYLYLPIVIR